MHETADANVIGHPDDFQLAVLACAGISFEWSKVLLARAHFHGTLELLTAAWERVLGYGREEFAGKTLHELMRSTKPSPILAAILRRTMEPVDLTLHAKDGQP